MRPWSRLPSCIFGQGKNQKTFSTWIFFFRILKLKIHLIISSGCSSEPTLASFSGSSRYTVIFQDVTLVFSIFWALFTVFIRPEKLKKFGIPHFWRNAPKVFPYKMAMENHGAHPSTWPNNTPWWEVCFNDFKDGGSSSLPIFVGRKWMQLWVIYIYP